jgi:hypothetical protein
VDLGTSILGRDAEGQIISYIITHVISPIKFFVKLRDVRDPKTPEVTMDLEKVRFENLDTLGFS